LHHLAEVNLVRVSTCSETCYIIISPRLKVVVVYVIVHVVILCFLDA